MCGGVEIKSGFDHAEVSIHTKREFDSKQLPQGHETTIEREKQTPWAVLKLSGVGIKSSSATLQFRTMKTLLSNCEN